MRSGDTTRIRSARNQRRPETLGLLLLAIVLSALPCAPESMARDLEDLPRLVMSPIDTVRLSSPGLRGLAFDEHGGWMLMSSHWGLSAPDSAFQASVLRWDRSAGTTDTLVSEASSFETGLAYDGEFLWAAGCLLGQAASLYQIEATIGTIELTLPTLGYHLGGLIFDEEYLWQVDADARKLFRLETEEAKVSRRVSSPGFYPTGLAYDGYHFWNADAATGRLYRLRGFNGRIDGVVSEDIFLRPGEFVTLGFDGAALWVAASTDSVAVRYAIHE
jgi:hypothetical protein